MKVLKWILIGIVAIVVLGIGYLALFLDPNDFKPQIVAAVEKQTGRQFKIEKDLGWTFFPSVGIKAGGMILGNPKSFSEPTFVSVNNVMADVELMPLFSKQVKVSELVLDGLRINLVTDKSGKTSLDGLSGNSAKTVPAKSAETSSAPATGDQLTLTDLSIGGVSVTDAEVRMLDQRSGSENIFKLASFKLGELTLDKFASLDYQLSAALDGMTVESEGHGQLKIAKSLQQFALKDLTLTTVAKGASLPTGKVANSVTLDADVDTSKTTATTSIKSLAVNDIKGNGKLSVNYGGTVPHISAKLSLGEIEVDKWLPEKAQSETTEAKKETQTATAATEPDLTGMKAVNADFELDVASIKAAGTLSKNWKMVIALKNGVMNMKQLSAELYDGTLAANASVDGRNPVAKYSFDSQIKAINIRALLKDAADTELLDGTADIAIKGAGSSLIPDNIKKGLNANGQFAVNNGALYGVNVPQMIRSAQAKLKGDFTDTDKEAKKTDFTSLTGSFTVAKGVANNPDLLMASPLIRISGKGDANLVDESLDYKLTTALVNSLKGQGGKELDDLVGVEIPLAIKGSFTDPKFSLDTDALMKSKVKQEADKAKDKLKDSLLKKLGL
ncbi:cell envelope biogenesis protein AsmA [Shewanella mangrovi]|uniref:Cell envelope biogenesis protein AsmA n=1 Tax=Shewanella mangrovi TaxID=1515746 RepID=A0A094JDH1_9GAMM|nr:AsmA family protein [Shewanella mangrovi]KFZ37272.1 cell envelope biogenesis protein AsmA [Shewanella mangrovi]